MLIEEIDILLLKDHLHLEGVVHNERVSVMFPREPKVFPDFGASACVYCGEGLPPRRRKYCCDDHGHKYRADTYPYIVFWWRDLRSAVIERDGFTCQDCGFKRVFESDHPRAGEAFEIHGDFEVHHFVLIHCGGEEFDAENCITYCPECHTKQHRFRKLEGTGITQSRLEVGFV